MVAPPPTKRPLPPGNRAQFEKQRKARLKQLERALVVKARKDFFTFASLVLRDEMTGDPVKMSAVHRYMCDSAVKEQYAIFLACPEVGKSQLIVVAYTLWCLGRNPRETIAVVCATKERSKELISTVKRYIEDSVILRRIFPNLQPGATWTETRLRVKGSGQRTTPSVAAYGVGNKAIMGQRLDKILIDDVDNVDTIQSETTRDSQFRYIARNALNRLMPGGQILMVTNAWHVEDVSSRLAKSSKFKTIKIPITVTHDVKRQWPGYPYPLGASIWPERWPKSRIIERRNVTITTAGETEWRRCYYCEPMRDGASFFREAHIDAAKRAGEGLCMPSHLADLFLESGMAPERIRDECERYLGFGAAPRGWEPELRIIHGVDIASGVNNDLSGIVTLMEYLKTGQIRPLYAEEGNWHISETLKRIQSLKAAFGGIVVVETTGIQLATADLMEEYGGLQDEMFGFPTKLKDKVLGPQAIAADFASGKVLIPSVNGVCATQGLEDLLAGFRAMNPRDHTRDIAMAGLFAFGTLRAYRLSEFGEQGGRTTVSF